MGHLCPRMHAGVGATGAMNVHRHAEKLSDCLFEQPLHGDKCFITLALKAGKAGTIVTQSEFIRRHRITHLVAIATTRMSATMMPAMRSRLS